MIFRNPNNEKCYKSDLIGKQVLFIWDEFWTFSCSLRGVKYEGIFLRKTMTHSKITMGYGSRFQDYQLSNRNKYIIISDIYVNKFYNCKSWRA